MIESSPGGPGQRERLISVLISVLINLTSLLEWERKTQGGVGVMTTMRH